MILPIRDANGFPKAECRCDDCGKVETVAAAHEKQRGNIGPRVNEGRVIKKLAQRNWRYAAHTLRCPECEAKRRSSTKEQIMPENVTPIRTPTREQKREIISMLDIAYDTTAGRYKGADTDLTIADSIGGGVMPGWVAEIREDLYGPDGGNDEIEKIIADLRQWQDEMSKMAAKMHDSILKSTAELRAFNEGRGRADEFLKRIEAIKAAVGPKAARA